MFMVFFPQINLPFLHMSSPKEQNLYRFLWCTTQVFANTLKAMVKGMSEVKLSIMFLLHACSVLLSQIIELL